jgi:hypothetical protein
VIAQSRVSQLDLATEALSHLKIFYGMSNKLRIYEDAKSRQQNNNNSNNNNKSVKKGMG